MIMIIMIMIMIMIKKNSDNIDNHHILLTTTTMVPYSRCCSKALTDKDVKVVPFVLTLMSAHAASSQVQSTVLETKTTLNLITLSPTP